MIAKSLIAAAAIAATLSVAAPVQQAEAKTNVDINIGFGLGGGYGYGGYDGYYAYYPEPIYEPRYRSISCSRGARIVDRSGFHDVRAVDCSLPGYQYVAWRHGHQYLVLMDRRGTIVDVNRIY